MAILDILHFPDPRLRKIAATVTAVDGEVQRLVNDLFETVYHAPGIGLAAPQVNVARRIMVIDISEYHDQPFCFINPEILDRRGEETGEEGCLSVPGIYDAVKRAQWVRVRAWDRTGQSFDLEAEGLLAVCLQHEIDHLDGKLFVDYLSSLKRHRIRKKLGKARHQHHDTAAASSRHVVL